jgi:hypothetical protein
MHNITFVLTKTYNKQFIKHVDPSLTIPQRPKI